ncbi:unnamed protein product [Paramecium sonneborni]|uniref:Glutathione peroxidase n=1 Tax=Paramecium sonneborni TaxID=65129 RepID=A0A8S1L4P3_9CILI|nr:unnamed protein product [Paramecium sonneborni]
MGALFFKKGVDKLQPTTKSFFEFELNNIDGQRTKLSQFKGKKAYICVNVACSCGLTSSNYSELVELYKTYSAQGLEILGFPCNQFMGQESKPEPEIKQFVISKYGVSFPLFQKIEVNGQNTHEVYKYLRLNSSLKVSANEAKEVPWNFGKFLLNSEGQVISFYNPDVKPKQMKQEIEKLLNH